MDKQTGKLIARIAENLPDMHRDLMQWWIDNPLGLQKFLEGLCMVHGALGPATEVTVGPLTEAFDPNAFFQNREGLHVWGNFKLALSGAAIQEPTGAVTLKRRPLLLNAYDQEIKARLPADHEVSPWVIAEFIEAQPGGKTGPLPTDGTVAIFYTAGYAVNIHWYRVDREWSVSASRFDGYDRNADSSVFSRN